MPTAMQVPMTRLPSSAVLARLRARARAEGEAPSGERSVVPPATPEQKLRWLGSDTLRAPREGHIDIVQLGRRR